MRNLAVIPMRSNSERIKHKNIKLVAGHPLMYYPIDCARQVNAIDKIIVATNNDYYAEIARGYDVDVVMRPPEISGPSSKTEETLLYVICEMEKRGEFYDNVILLQATSPLNRPEYIEEGLKALADNHFKSVLTYTNDTKFSIDEPDILERPMTQNKEPKKTETGCFWITNIEALKKEKNRICFPCAYVEVSEIAALDIDTPEDLMIVEVFLEKEMRVKEGKYFETRTYDGGFEDYYDIQLDPDGNKRNMLEERERKITFCKNEITFVNSLVSGSQKRLLDLGCGAGFVSSAIDDAWIKYGLEVSEKAAQIARKYISNLHIGPLEKTTYNEEFFNLVLCHHVIEHVKDPISLIKNVHRILKTHGHLVISTPNFDSGTARRFGDRFRMLHDKTHVSLFSDWSLRELLSDYGFQVDRIDYPYFETGYFTEENLLRLFDTSKISPPFYGNIMTLYARKK
ncbi:MAG: methyltransferase domain-containing protein [Sedimentisphaerales bacterium]